jgi:hypothetical protein
MGPGRRLLAFVGCLSLLVPVAAFGAETIPAPASRAASKASDAAEAGDGEDSRYTTVVGDKRFKDSDPVGDYAQPVWTVTRRFPTTRVYVLPKGTVELEYWLTTQGQISDDSEPSYESQLEVEFGLGHRLQLDLYLVFGQGGYDAPLGITKEKIELRYAFADWGKLWGNPAVYLEWIRQHEKPQKGEVKLLLGDQISPRWFWGFNLVFERALGGESAQEYAATAGISCSAIDNYLGVGIEMRAVAEDVQGARFDFVEKKLLAGPSVQWKPVRGLHIDLVPMFGVEITDETEGVYTVYLIVGKDL